MLVEEALDLIKKQSTPELGSEIVSLKDGLGRVLAENIFSPIAVPQYDNSAVDGYALRCSDLNENKETVLPILGSASAGKKLKINFKPGHAIKIFTGASIPHLLDTIVMQENCTTSETTITVPPGQKTGSNCRKAGEDINQYSEIFSKGHRLRPQDIGLIASTGHNKILVNRRLKVAVFSTGNEICEPGKKLNQFSIYDSNRYSLIALLSALGCKTTDLGIIKDDPDIIKTYLINAASNNDLIISSGGVSKGGEDHVSKVIKIIGSPNIWKLAIKPGKPLIIGKINNTAFVGLPGNPAALMVTFLRIIRPLILKLSGAKKLEPIFFNVLSGFNYNKKPHRREWIRASLIRSEDGKSVAKKFEYQGSGILTSMVQSDGLIELPENITFINTGDEIQFLPYSEVLS